MPVKSDPLLAMKGGSVESLNGDSVVAMVIIRAADIVAILTMKW